MKIECEGKTLELAAGATAGEVWRALHGDDFSADAVLAECGGDVLDFRTPLPEMGGALSWVPLASRHGFLAAQRTLVMLLVCAVRELYGEAADVEIKHSLGDSLYCEFADGHTPLVDALARLEEKMKALAAARLPISRLVVDAHRAAAFLRSLGDKETAEVLLRRDVKELSAYRAGEVTDYYFGPMLPDMGCVPAFRLAPYAPGFLLRFPPAGETELAPYEEDPLFAKVFLEAEEWGEIIGCHNVRELNRAIAAGGVGDLVAMAEAQQEKRLAQLADKICGARPGIRLVCIAGPSSAGKTTFMSRLVVHLRVNGARPVLISLDDFYRERKEMQAAGETNYENLSALDVALFQKLMAELLEGKPVRLPRFDFQTGERSWSGEVRLDAGQPILVEGLHALNPALSHFVPGYQCMHIYLSALTQLSVNNHNRISTSDTRLLRRLVRDARSRGHGAEKTLELWATVRRGEEENIFLFQGRADEIFDTALIYELPVLKRKAVPLLSAIGKDSPVYAEARRLLTFLMPFEELPEEIVPANSLLREFIGK